MIGARETIVAIACLLAAAPALAELETFSADSRLSFGYGSAVGERMQDTVEIEPRFELTTTDTVGGTVSARLRLDFMRQLEPGRTPTDTYSSLSRPITIDDLGSIELRDAYVELLLRRGVLRLGKQQIVWGRLDGVKVLDVVNPQDFREFILQDFDYSRIGLWSAYLDLSFGKWRTEFAAIPDNTGHAIPAAGAWFELRASRFRYGADGDDPVPTVVTDRGSPGFDSGALAARLSRQFGSVEISGVAYTGLDHEPLGRLRSGDSGVVLERYYARREVFGLSAETAFGGIALRGELAFQPSRTFNTRTPLGLASARLDQVIGGIGIDFDAPFDIFVNVQHLVDDIRDAPATLVRPSSDRITTVLLRRSFAYDSLELTARWYYGHELRDRMYSIGAEYRLSDSTRLSLTAETFDGDPEGLFGQFADVDRVTVALAHTF